MFRRYGSTSFQNEMIPKHCVNIKNSKCQKRRRYKAQWSEPYSLHYFHRNGTAPVLATKRSETNVSSDFKGQVFDSLLSRLNSLTVHLPCYCYCRDFEAVKMFMNLSSKRHDNRNLIGAISRLLYSSLGLLLNNLYSGLNYLQYLRNECI